MLFDPCGASKVRSSARLAGFATFACANIWMPAAADAQRLPPYLADRGTGIATSMFGEYVHKGELLVYPFHEFTAFNQFEYKPAELDSIRIFAVSFASTKRISFLPSASAIALHSSWRAHFSRRRDCAKIHPTPAPCRQN